MARAPSRHGLERKYKPWRKGKSAKKSSQEGLEGCSGGGSLKNRIRGQKRLLQRLLKDKNDGRKSKESKEDVIGSVKRKIELLETELKEFECRRREKKNAVKYHQVKFIERQKVTRLEKSLRRQLNQLSNQLSSQSSNQSLNELSGQSLSGQPLSGQSLNNSLNDSPLKIKVASLRKELAALVMYELYIAHFPNNEKYVALFPASNHLQSQQRGHHKQERIWGKIHHSILQNLAMADEATATKQWVQNSLQLHTFQHSSSQHNSHHSRKETLKQLLQAFPTFASIQTVLQRHHANNANNASQRIDNSQNHDSKLDSPSNQPTDQHMSKTNHSQSDNRFVLSKKHTELFHDQSTAGDDYVMHNSGSSPTLTNHHNHHDKSNTDDNKANDDKRKDPQDIISSDDNSSSSSSSKGLQGNISSDDDDDDADPLESYSKLKSIPSILSNEEYLNYKDPDGNSSKSANMGRNNESSSHDSSDDDSGSEENEVNDEQNLNLKSTRSSSSSSSSESNETTSDSSSDSDDSTSNHKQTKTQIKSNNNNNNNKNHHEEDDFFTTEEISTEKIFASINHSKQNHHHHHNNNNNNNNNIQENQWYIKQKPDKSKGFVSQRQTKRDYRAYKSRQKRQRYI